MLYVLYKPPTVKQACSSHYVGGETKAQRASSLFPPCSRSPPPHPSSYISLPVAGPLDKPPQLPAHLPVSLRAAFFIGILVGLQGSLGGGGVFGGGQGGGRGGVTESIAIHQPPSKSCPPFSCLLL